jgi:hypothetical protein
MQPAPIKCPQAADQPQEVRGWKLSGDESGQSMSFRWSVHLALLGPTRAHWLEDSPDATGKDSTRQHAVDDPLLSCKQQLGELFCPAYRAGWPAMACRDRQLASAQATTIACSSEDRPGAAVPPRARHG